MQYRAAMAGFVFAVLAWVQGSSSAEACSPPAPTPTTALPATGAANVSTATSLIVHAGGLPSGLSLVANGQNVPLSYPDILGSSGHAVYWRVHAATADSMLIGGAEHILSQTSSAGTTVELTRFTTAAGYDKAAGVAPVLRALHLWRVRYPVADIGSGNCVFAEYHGFITVDYEPATVPNTPPSSVVHTFSLGPKNGGSQTLFAWAGDAPFVGLEPSGAYPLPLGDWQPELDPTRQYCLTIAALGDGDLARPALASETVCADVVQLAAAGAPPPPQIGGGAAGGGGCAVAGATDPTLPVSILLVAAISRAARRAGGRRAGAGGRGTPTAPRPGRRS